MKKYFAVYLPVEGEIKEHDMVFKDQKELATVIHIYPDGEAFHLEFSDNWTTTATYPKDRVKKAALHIVTRHVNPGDNVIDWLNPGLETLTFKENIYSEDDARKEHPVPVIILGHLDNKEIEYVEHNIFKKIGPVSPGAIWVKQGDDFEPGDLANMFQDQDGMEHIPFSEKKILFYMHEDVYVHVKCPTCKTFH